MANIKTSSDPIVDTIRASLPETVNLDEDLEKDFASARENLTVVLSRRDKRDGTYMAGAGSSCGLGPNGGSDVEMNDQTEV